MIILYHYFNYSRVVLWIIFFVINFQIMLSIFFLINWIILLLKFGDFILIHNQQSLENIFIFWLIDLFIPFLSITLFDKVLFMIRWIVSILNISILTIIIFIIFSLYVIIIVIHVIILNIFIIISILGIYYYSNYFIIYSWYYYSTMFFSPTLFLNISFS